MSFKIAERFFYSGYKRQTSHIMILVFLVSLPSIALQFYFFGWGVIFQIILSCFSAIASEALVLWLRKMAIVNTLFDNSSLLTGLLLAISIPPLSPWWIVVLGANFSIIIAKQLYGGLGSNLFNPAMIGYVVLLVSFPIQMTNQHLSSNEIAVNTPNSFVKVLQIIFTSQKTEDNLIDSRTPIVDGVSQATPLAFKTKPFCCAKKKLMLQNTYDYSAISTYNGNYNLLKKNNKWECINFAWLLGGLFLISQRVIRWHIPISFLLSLIICSVIGRFFSPNTLLSPRIHLFYYKSTMLGAFFIATDPVTSPSTNYGRLMFGALSGLLVWLIRSFSDYSDGVAFAVLLSNISVPLIDYYTRPRAYGHS